MNAVLTSLEPLVTSLRDAGYTVVGPAVRNGAIELTELTSAARLPYGWGVETSPGQYRLKARTDRAAFGHAAGPQGWKRFLLPPKELLATIDRDGDGLVTRGPQEPPARYAFLGVRPCDLRAIAVQDRVLGGAAGYAARRRELFIVAVNCTEPSPTCFCVSAGGGPAAGDGYDLVLTELTEPKDGGQPRYLASAATERAEGLLAALPQSPETPELRERAAAVVAAAEAQLRRADEAQAEGRYAALLPAGDLHAMLKSTMESKHWDEVAAKCLTCANCTLVCPTCFCTSVADTTDLTGEHAERWQRWASCFELDYSYIHGGGIRQSASSRYRQWLTHKLGTWHDQFGESGCVGCGRCIAWCPAGIDITAEATALAAEAGTLAGEAAQS
jgi:ferredoxin